MGDRTIRYLSLSGERSRRRRVPGLRGVAAAGLVAVSGLIAVPASAHSSTYCLHGQKWNSSYAYAWPGVIYLKSYTYTDGHYHQYRHATYYPGNGATITMHANVTRQC